MENADWARGYVGERCWVMRRGGGFHLRSRDVTKLLNSAAGCRLKCARYAAVLWGQRGADRQRGGASDGSNTTCITKFCLHRASTCRLDPRLLAAEYRPQPGNLQTELS